MDQLYLLLITNKGSNIMEDLDTLRLLGKGAVIVPGGLQGVSPCRTACRQCHFRVERYCGSMAVL